MTIKRESIIKASNTLALNWATTDINAERALGPVNWEALQEYAINVKRKHAGNHDVQTTCQLSSEYNMGGLNLVRRLEFQDGTSWIARIQLHKSASTGRLVREIDTMAVVRERSNISVPEVFAYEADCNNAVGVPFMIMEFIPGDTAMDSFGGHRIHKGKTPPQFKAKFHAEMADIQVSSQRIFPESTGQPY
jgi:aminoglycoside phosphotransferase (APT) family kinase protein